MNPVSREEFLAYVGPRDIIPVSRKDHTLWQTRGQLTVGRTTPGYANHWGPNGPTPATYELIAGATKPAG